MGIGEVSSQLAAYGSMPAQVAPHCVCQSRLGLRITVGMRDPVSVHFHNPYGWLPCLKEK
jgi:hypothetical protein